jgi:endo-1,4-beta-xylanase
MRHGLLISLAVISLIVISFNTSFAETTNYVYDELNRLIRVEYGNGTVIEYIYDSAGNRRYVRPEDTVPPVTTGAPAGGADGTAQSGFLGYIGPTGGWINFEFSIENFL